MAECTFEEKWDGKRLNTLRDRVRVLMQDGKWRTLEEIQAFTGGRETGVAAKLRDLRKPQCGGLIIERRRRGSPNKGHWEYRLISPVPQPLLFDISPTSYWR